ncbi:MAG: Ig-like domain repeat protein [Clostridiales Family XIII bacterium]|jgi:hypothetical protein|nr:Ig-like domain repeat protein [Clostridiales Family XIII bacterium]
METNTSIGALYVTGGGVTTWHAITSAPAYFLFDDKKPTISGIDYDNDNQEVTPPEENSYFGPLTVSGIASDASINFDNYDFDSGPVTVYYTTGATVATDDGDKRFITTGASVKTSFSQYFPTESKYTIWVEDKSGNQSDGITFEVFIDERPPRLEGKIEIAQRDHSVLEGVLSDFENLHRFDFGNFFSQDVTVTVSAVDMSYGKKPIGVGNIELLSLNNIKITHQPLKKTTESGVATQVFTISGENAFAKEKLTVRLSDRNKPLNITSIAITTANAVTAIDSKGITSDEFTMDKQPPGITAISVENRVSLQDNPILVTEAPIFSGSVSDNYGSVSDNYGLNRLIPQINDMRIATADSGFHYYTNRRNPKPNDTFTLRPGEGIFGSLTHANDDGSYLFSLTAVDNAGNKSESSQTAWYDATKPDKGEIRFEYPDAASAGFDMQPFYQGNKPYGYFYKEDTTITVSAIDRHEQYQTTSGIRFISVYGMDYANGPDNPTEYYMDGAGRLVVGSTAEAAKSDVNGFNDARMSINVTIPRNFKGQIYAVATDRAGNASDIAEPNEGVIVEDEGKHESTSSIELSFNAPSEKHDASAGKLPLYNGDVKIDLIVKDTHSGVKTVTWHAIAPDREVTAEGQYEVDHTGAGAKTGNGDDWAVVTKDKNLATEVAGSVTVSRSVNSNNISLLVNVTDNAGNTSSGAIDFSIDTTKPTIKVTYDNNTPDTKYTDQYNQPRTATVVVTDRNFDQSQSEIIREIERITDDGTRGGAPSFGSWTTKAEYASDKKTLADATTHTFKVRFAQDGDYTFNVGYTDLAGNKATDRRSKFTIDRTVPVIRVAYDRTFVTENYYGDAVVATISVVEHNFDSSRVNITGTASDEGDTVAFPTLSNWSKSGNTYTATLNYGTDALFNFDIDVTDKAGNQSGDYPVDEFFVDQSDPEVTIGGIRDHQATNGAVVQPTVTFFDKNYDESRIAVELTPVSPRSLVSETPLVDGGSWTLRDTNGGRFTMENFPEHSDDIYNLKATITDRAGHEAGAEIAFSINRDGSTFEVARGDNVELTQDAYYNTLFDVVVTEVNVNDLLLGKGRITHSEGSAQTETLFEDGVAKDGVTVEPNHPGGNGAWTDWSETTYTIPSEVFSNEVKHDIFVESEDEATNQNDNKNVTNGNSRYISFTTDMTPPDIIVRGLPDRPVNANSLTLVATVEDKILLGDKVDEAHPVAITLNGNPVDDYTVSGDENVKEISFVVSASNSPQTFAIEAEDRATNTAEFAYPERDENGNIITALVISTNPVALWFYNKPVFISSIVGVAAVIAFISYMVYRRRRLGKVV